MVGMRVGGVGIREVEAGREEDLEDGEACFLEEGEARGFGEFDYYGGKGGEALSKTRDGSKVATGRDDGGLMKGMGRMPEARIISD